MDHTANGLWGCYVPRGSNKLIASQEVCWAGLGDERRAVDAGGRGK